MFLCVGSVRHRKVLPREVVASIPRCDPVLPDLDEPALRPDDLHRSLPNPTISDSVTESDRGYYTVIAYFYSQGLIRTKCCE